MYRLAAALSALLFAVPALAETVTPSCDGQVATIHFLRVRPGGSMAGLQHALNAMDQWSAEHHKPAGRHVLARVMSWDEYAESTVVEPDQLVAIEMAPTPLTGGNAQDAAWNAVATQFARNAEIHDERVVCLPPHAW